MALYLISNDLSVREPGSHSHGGFNEGSPCPQSPGASLLKGECTDLKHQHLLGAGEKCRVLGPKSDLRTQNLILTKS